MARSPSSLSYNAPNQSPLLPTPLPHPPWISPHISGSSNMSTSPPSILSRIHNTLALHTEHSVCVYVSADGANFDAYPSPLFGSSITEFSSVLPDLNTRIVIQASNVFIQQAVALTYVVAEMASRSYWT